MAGKTILVREAFRPVYRELNELGKRGDKRFKRLPPQNTIAPDKVKYPLVRIFPNGDVIGIHPQLKKYLNDCKVTGKRRKTGPTTVESHHLLEDRLMKHLGIHTNEGLCVALEQVDHSYYSGELPRHLPRGDFMADIDVVYEASCEMYKASGHPEWIPIIRHWLKSNRIKILNHYSTTDVAGATDKDRKRVQRFFNKL
ncbi:hypothetical protein AB1L42_12585 [Thalassoglobus sp. JC818]|uniref:hypothetical protein n=1 Tax=Thalassoglobus sp. JC818 TaxID=3232136 RepID=UPI00345A6A7A